MMMMTDSNLSGVILDMAKNIWGEPTSVGADGIYRFKKSKGVAVNVADATWFDFTEGQGGGVLDMVDTYFPDRKRTEVFKQFGGVDFLLGLMAGIHEHIDI
jgi:hypothetical protein